MTSGGWQLLPIKEVCQGIYDGPHATPRPSDTGPVFLGIKNVTEDGRLDLSEIRHIAEDDFAGWTRRVEPRAGDVVFTYEATLNRYAVIPEGFRGCLGRRMALIRPDVKKVDTRFLHFYLFTDEWRTVISNHTLRGATVDRIPLMSFPDFPVRVPSLPAQRRIAGILSAYDDLIENNVQRVRILEEMARALYREWFVESRFPGCERERRIASPVGPIPASWRVTDLERVCRSTDGIQTGPFGSQLHESDYTEDGIPVVMPRDLLGFRIDTRSIARVPESVAARLARHRLEPGDIVYGRRGDIGRRAYVMPYQVGWLCATGCLRLRPDPKAINGWYLFNYLGRDAVVAIIAGRAHGVTLPNLNARLMTSVPVVVPSMDLQRRFCDLTMPIAQARETLTAQNDTLRRTRDLLLPRLLSGQITLKNTAG